MNADTVSSIVDRVLASSREELPATFDALDERTKQRVRREAEKQDVSPEAFWKAVLAQREADARDRSASQAAAVIAREVRSY